MGEKGKKSKYDKGNKERGKGMGEEGKEDGVIGGICNMTQVN